MAGCLAGLRAPSEHGYRSTLIDLTVNFSKRQFYDLSSFDQRSH